MTRPIHICVFSGSSSGTNPAYVAAARALGQTLAERDITVVYGGASIGLMGAVADAALAHDGRVIGVLPESIARVEVAHNDLSALEIVPSMHARKARMAELSDAFITLPGGFGSLDETFEMLTWAQLGIQQKPLGLLNVAGFYDGLLAFMDQLVTEGFVKQSHRDMVFCDATQDALLARLLEADAGSLPDEGKWLD